MGTYNEDCERVAVAVRAVTDHDTQVVPGEGVYVNFGYNEALVIEPYIGPGLMWQLTAYAWDQTGGVSAERELGHVRERFVTGLAKVFLDERDRETQQLTDLLASIPEDL